MRHAIALTLAAATALVACKPTEVGPGATSSQKAKVEEDVVGRAARERGPVVMPPSIAGTGSFRCADNSLAIVEFYSDGRSATVRTTEGDSPVKVVSTETGGTMKAEGGWTLKGAPKDPKVTFSSPNHPKPMSCHV
jgi:hypothetical protein